MSSNGTCPTAATDSCIPCPPSLCRRLKLSAGRGWTFVTRPGMDRHPVEMVAGLGHPARDVPTGHEPISVNAAAGLTDPGHSKGVCKRCASC